jgi:hypothetical protein
MGHGGLICRVTTQAARRLSGWSGQVVTDEGVEAVAVVVQVGHALDDAERVDARAARAALASGNVPGERR